MYQKKYQVVSWVSRDIIWETDDLNKAKKKCRSIGHELTKDPILTGYPPIAFVQEGDLGVVYNPRFKKFDLMLNKHSARFYRREMICEYEAVHRRPWELQDKEKIQVLIDSAYQTAELLKYRKGAISEMFFALGMAWEDVKENGDFTDLSEPLEMLLGWADLLEPYC